MLRIEDDALAELHAVVNVKEDGTVQILDLGSSEGSKVNGEAVSGNADLASGDTISVGPINIALTIETPEEAVEEATQPVPEEEEEVENTDQVPEAIVAAAASEAAAEESGNASIADAGEDVMAFIMRSGTASSDAGVDRKKAKVLEVAEIWADAVMDVKHYDPLQPAYLWVHPRVTGGASSDFRWAGSPRLREAGLAAGSNAVRSARRAS